MLALKINVWFRTGTLRALVWGMRTETKQETLHRVDLELIVRVKCYGHDRWNRVSTDGVLHYFKLLCYISLVVDYGGGGGGGAGRLLDFWNGVANGSSNFLRPPNNPTKFFKDFR